MRVKICGITKPLQGRAIVHLGATALGFICVPTSPRYVTVEQIQAILEHLPPERELGRRVDRIGVFANTPLEGIHQTVAATGLQGVQLHGAESPEFCQQLRALLPEIELIKALRVQSAASLEQAAAYAEVVHTLLLDAYQPHQLGGTGQTLNWQGLRSQSLPLPWFLAGGLTPHNILEALEALKPHGIDLSSGVEQAPGDKDLAKVAKLFEILNGVIA